MASVYINAHHKSFTVQPVVYLLRVGVNITAIGQEIPFFESFSVKMSGRLLFAYFALILHGIFCVCFVILEFKAASTWALSR